jgi:uncharacterized protein YbdZ (MbtH family)
MNDDPNEVFRAVKYWDEQYSPVEKYSIWPVGKDLPDGWTEIGKTGTYQECMDHVVVMGRFQDVFRALNYLRDGGSILEWALTGPAATFVRGEGPPPDEVVALVTLPAGERALGFVHDSVANLFEFGGGRGDFDDIYIRGIRIEFVDAVDPAPKQILAVAETMKYAGVPIRVAAIG